MKFTTKNRYSTSYRGTVDLKDPTDATFVKSLRENIKQSNKTAATKRQVVLMGRLGPNNPASIKYKGRSYQYIKAADAATFDIYIYNRN